MRAMVRTVWAAFSWRRVVRGPEASISSWVRAEVRAPHQMEERQPFWCTLPKVHRQRGGPADEAAEVERTR